MGVAFLGSNSSTRAKQGYWQKQRNKKQARWQAHDVDPLRRDYESRILDFVTYTRYADDLTFSAKRTGYLVNVERQIRQVIRDLRWPLRLQINPNKTVLATTRYHRQVTGFVLSNQGQVSLGRDRKRLISASVHHALLGKLNIEQMAKLSGLLAFVNAVEPSFLMVLEGKYGSAVLEQIRAAPRQL